MLETIYSAEYHYGGNNPYIICNLSSPPGKPGYLLKPHLFSLILGTRWRLCELLQPLRRVEPQLSGVMNDITFVPATHTSWSGGLGFSVALKQTNKFMQQDGTDLALNVHVCCIMCNTETFRHSRTFVIIGGSFWTFKVWEFQCKYSTKYYIPGFDCLQTTPVFTTSQQQQWYTLLPKGTTGYWTHAKWIITRGEINFMGNNSM